MSSSQKIHLPDLISPCPFPWSVNPKYDQARVESGAWIDSFALFTGRRRDKFKEYDFELLMALTYPYASYEELRTCCDCNNLLFVYDELSDKLDGKGARALGDVLMNALSGREVDDSTFSKCASEFGDRLAKGASAKCTERFLMSISNYINAVSTEAQLRQNKIILASEPYMELRRENSGVKPFFALIEYAHGLSLPDDVFEDPTFMHLYQLGADSVLLANDLYSYSRERAKELDGNNYVTVIMKEKGLSMQQAIDDMGERILRIINQFVEGQDQLPSFGEQVDGELRKYLFSIGEWYIGNIIWSFRTPRYFGQERETVQKTLVAEVRELGDAVD